MITLSVSTDQEAFDAVVRHLHTMPEKCMYNNFCQYARDKDDNRCAIGAIMNGSKDQLVLLGASVGQLVMRQIVGVFAVSVPLLQSLQTAHDKGTWNDDDTVFTDWSRLSVIATEYDLDTTVLDGVSR